MARRDGESGIRLLEPFLNESEDVMPLMCRDLEDVWETSVSAIRSIKVKSRMIVDKGLFKNRIEYRTRSRYDAMITFAVHRLFTAQITNLWTQID